MPRLLPYPNTCPEQTFFVTGALPRVHLVTPAIVERTVARYGLSGILSARERATFDAFPIERRRQDWLAGRVAAKRALRATMLERGSRVTPYRAIEIWNDVTGAPRFTVDRRPELSRQLNISISHTNGAGLAAVGSTIDSGTVGVDIETTRSLSLALVSRVLGPSELARLSSEHIAPMPLVLWTAKEAAMKAANAACTALRHVELSWNGTRCVGARICGESVAGPEIVVRHRTVGPYTIAVALCR